MINEQKERLLELLADQAIFGLNNEEMKELEQLKTQFPDLENNFSFELTSAKISLTNSDVNKPLPENLRTKILADARNFFASIEENQNLENAAPRVDKNKSPLFAENVETVSQPKSSFWQWLGWAAAAAASVALAINLWTTRFQPQPETVKSPVPVQTPLPELSPAQKREQLLATAPDVVKTEWKAPKGETDITGDVVWSNSQQKGFLRLRGLPVNDPNKKTYQLWIFDETQNEKYPINGGVFNVNENGEVIVPIDPAIKVKKPKMFAVTAEKPGGVVVSNRENLMVVAKV